MIKIISGWSNPGGSTVAFINLCNLFNERGLDCTFYGPHHWHIDKCKSGYLDEVALNEEGESLILHYLKFPERPVNSKAVVLACHEKEVFPVKDIHPFWDDIVYVSESQKEWQREEGIVIPNVISDLTKPEHVTLGLPVGIIGDIDANKSTHVSIERALADGHKNILLFGKVVDEPYYQEYVKKYVDDKTVTLIGHADDKQGMYDSVSKVYHSSCSETFNFIKPECEATGTVYDGLDSAESGAKYLTKSQILTAWKKVLDIE